jgi:hypothetical protein
VLGWSWPCHCWRIMFSGIRARDHTTPAFDANHFAASRRQDCHLDQTLDASTSSIDKDNYSHFLISLVHSHFGALIAIWYRLIARVLLPQRLRLARPPALPPLSFDNRLLGRQISEILETGRRLFVVNSAAVNTSEGLSRGRFRFRTPC